MVTVLIIDDDLGTCDTFTALLGLEDIRCDAACDGASGVASACAKRYDLILVDLRLPDTNGLDVVRTLRAISIDCPIVVMTAFPTFDSCFAAGVLGATQYIAGPMIGNELITFVRAALRKEVRTTTAECSMAHAMTITPNGDTSSAAQRLQAAVPDHRALEIMRAVDRDLAAPIRGIAERVNLSASRIRHVFLAATGYSLGRFQQLRRLDTAARLLRSTRQRVSEIAYQVGLQPRSLDRAFQRRFGVSPREYRSRHIDSER